MPPHAAQRGFFIGVSLLLVGHQAVEVHVGANLGQMLAIIVLGVDLEHLHDQRVDILDIQIQSNRILGPELGLVRVGKINIDPLFQLLVLLRGQHGKQLLVVPQAVDDLHFGKLLFQILIADVRGEYLIVGGIQQKMLQIAPHQGLVVAHHRQHRHAAIVLLQIGRRLLPLDGLHEPRQDVDHVLGQAEILQEPLEIVFSLRAIEYQPLVQHVGLQRIELRVERLDEIPQPLEIGPHRRGVLPPIHIVRRMQTHQVSIHEVLLCQQVGLQLQALVEL